MSIYNEILEKVAWYLIKSNMDEGYTLKQIICS